MSVAPCVCPSVVLVVGRCIAHGDMIRRLALLKQRTPNCFRRCGATFPNVAVAPKMPFYHCRFFLAKYCISCLPLPAECFFAPNPNPILVIGHHPLAPPPTRRLERDLWSMIKFLRQPTNRFARLLAPPPPPSFLTLCSVLPCPPPPVPETPVGFSGTPVLSFVDARD